MPRSTDGEKAKKGEKTGAMPDSHPVAPAVPAKGPDTRTDEAARPAPRK